MSLRESLQVALLLAIGTLLHAIAPGYGGGMRPDLLLSMLFIVVLLTPRFQPTLLAGLLAGLLAAFTTTFPGGQIPSIFDKLAAAFVVLGIIKVLGGRVNQYVLSGLIGIVGTIVSGAIFLGSALVISGLPLPFSVLFTTVVLPATAINTVAVIILYPVVVFSKSAVEKVGNKSA